MESDIDHIATIIKKQDAEIASLRAELTAQKAEQKYLMGLAAADAEALRAELTQWTNTANLAGGVVHSLRAELAKLNKDREYEIGCLYRTIDKHEAADRQDAEKLASAIEAAFAERDSYMASNIKLVERIRQDAKEKARLREALEPFANAYDKAERNGYFEHLQVILRNGSEWLGHAGFQAADLHRAALVYRP